MSSYRVTQVREANLGLFPAMRHALAAAPTLEFRVPTTMSDVTSTAIELLIEFAIVPAANTKTKLATERRIASSGASA